MKKKGHWVLGGIVTLLFILFLGWLNVSWFYLSFSSILIIIGITTIYSIFPDIDHKSGTMTWWFIGTATFGVVISVIEILFNQNFINPLKVLIIACLLLVVTFIANNFLEHRGIIHSVPAGILFALPVWFLFVYVGFFALAYVNWHSHLLGDGYIFKIK